MISSRCSRCFWSFIALALTLAVGKADDSAGPPRPPLTAAERAQGYRNRALLALPRADQPAVLEAGEGRDRVKMRRRFQRFGGLRVLDVADDEELLTVMKRLRDSGRYEFVEPDYVVRPAVTPNDPNFINGDQWALRNTGQNGGVAGADISATSAWDVRTDASTVVVAVVDSGVRATHLDLAGNLWRNPGESGSGKENNGIDDDNNGYVDDVFGINALNSASQAGRGSPNDLDGHGTAVAGVIGAISNNGLGVSGIAWKVQIMSLKFLDTEGGLVSDEIECFDYAISKGAQIINASFGGAGYSQAALTALRRLEAAGIIVVAASGNDAENADLIPHYPTSYLVSNIVSVGNSTRTDEISPSSNIGSGGVDLFAPGNQIFTTHNASDTATISISGTSFSAPMVTGALALMKAQFPTDTYRQLINRLYRTVDRKTAFAGKVQTSGRLNVARALTSTDNRPFNDDFATAATLTGDYLTVRGSNTGAVRESGEPIHANVGGASSIWWSWTATRPGLVQIDTTESNFDTTLAVYAGDSPVGLVAVAANDNAPGLATSSVSFNATAGATYRIAVDGKGGANGFVVLNIGQVPSNDAFASATVASGRSFRIEGNNRLGTQEAGEPAIPRRTGRHSVWYQWQAPASGRYQLNAWSTVVDTMMGIYTGSSLGSLTTVATNIDGQNLQLSSQLAFTATAGVTYRFLVDTETEPGAFSLTLVDAEWQHLLDDLDLAVDSPPAVGADNTLYFTAEEAYLYALNPDGSRRWRYTMDEVPTYAAPAVGADGTVHAVDSSGVVYAVNPGGTLKWRFPTGSVVIGSPALGADGVVYVRAQAGSLFAINPDGTGKWTAPIPGESYTSPSIGADGIIYIGASTNLLYAINTNGSTRWTYDAGDGIYASPAIGADGTIYVGTLGRRLHAIRPDGTLRWTYLAGDSISSSAAIGPDGTLYFGSYDQKLHAVNADGTGRWTYDLGGEVRTSSPAVAADGSIYIGTLDGQLHAVNANGTGRRVYYFAEQIRSSPLIHNGMLYIGSDDARLTAIAIGLTPASSAWPMFGQNVRRTARSTVQPLTLPLPPVSQTVAAGSPVTFSVGALGSGTLTYQWRLDGVAIAGASGLSYTVGAAQPADAGSYTVTVTDASGSITSPAATLVVTGGTDVTNDNPGRLSSLSVRSTAGTGAQTLIVGVATTNGAKTVLVRGIGPTLQLLNVSGFLADPQLTVFDTNAAQLATNDDWETPLSPTFSAVGTFALVPGTKDAALSLFVPAGTFTAHVGGKAGQTGIALVEVYETETGSRPANAAKFRGLSARSQVGTGGDILIAGFAVTGDTPRKVLIRGVGPGLTQLGVTGVLADPQLALFRGETRLIDNNDWTIDAAASAAAASTAGAFPLPAGSKDAVLVVSLAPGVYTAQVSGVSSTTGVALVEVYELP